AHAARVAEGLDRIERLVERWAGVILDREEDPSALLSPIEALIECLTHWSASENGFGVAFVWTHQGFKANARVIATLKEAEATVSAARESTWEVALAGMDGETAEELRKSRQKLIRVQRQQITRQRRSALG